MEGARLDTTDPIAIWGKAALGIRLGAIELDSRPVHDAGGEVSPLDYWKLTEKSNQL